MWQLLQAKRSLLLEEIEWLACGPSFRIFDVEEIEWLVLRFGPSFRIFDALS
jgi:hypothetical protein